MCVGVCCVGCVVDVFCGFGCCMCWWLYVGVVVGGDLCVYVVVGVDWWWCVWL